MRNEDFENTMIDAIDHDPPATVPATVKTTTATAPAGTKLINPFDLFLQREEGSDAFFEGDFITINGQTGVWMRRKELISTTTRFLCNMREIALGWVKFVDGKVQDRMTGFLIDGYERPPREALDDYEERHWPFNRQGKREDPWKKTTYLPMRCVEDDENVVFGPFADTQRKAIRQFIAIYRRTERDGRVPVVLLENRSFPNNSGGTTYVPTFKIIGWEYWNGVPPPELQPVKVPAAPAAKPVLTKPAAAADRRDDMDDEIPF
jgi:hypothetical protein